jgi:UDP-N-acetylglucosamine 2-epimerase (non-hydrolysing)
MNRLPIDLVAGARPNFMKLAPLVRALALPRIGIDPRPLPFRIVHTGQHYDPGMNDVFFRELEIPEPDVHLDVGSGSHGVQTARIIERYEKHLFQSRPAATVVFGDVNSTAACALVAAKLGVPVVHVEAGLRSFDRTMPEEINRIVTDALADLLFVSEQSGVENLKREGVDAGKVHLVGNVMIDTLAHELPKARALGIPATLGLEAASYALVTMHRPSNVDDPAALERLLVLLRGMSARLPMVFPVHPRTRRAAQEAGLSALLECTAGFVVLDPIPYRENLSLMADARLVLTDSGGMQEETTYLKIPCLTLRENTERPITVDKGTSRLVGNDVERIRAGIEEILSGRWPQGEDIPLWDGHTAERVADELTRFLAASGSLPS